MESGEDSEEESGEQQESESDIEDDINPEQKQNTDSSDQSMRVDSLASEEGEAEQVEEKNSAVWKPNFKKIQSFDAS